MTFFRYRSAPIKQLVRLGFRRASPVAIGFGVALLPLVTPLMAMAEEAAGEAEEFKGLPQFEASTFPSQLFWLVISFGIFFFLMRQFFVPKIGARLEFRENIIRDNMQTAEKLLARGKKMENDLEEKLTSARGAARVEMTTAAATVASQQEEALKQFQKKSDGVVANANGMLQKIKSDIEKEKQTLVDNLSKEIVKKILS
ncbi:MAG: hypothetical protein QM529_03305 [Hydrotalea sp.]|nr:hypothetical protein [Hydrotalea sp.]